MHSLKQSLTFLSENFLRLIAIDIAINCKKIMWGLIFGGLAMLFAFIVWVALMSALSEYLLSQGVNYHLVVFAIILLNLIGLTSCLTLSYQKLKNIGFNYTESAIEKIKASLRTKNENS